MNRLKLTISYDGTTFSGWQIQPNGISIQETIEKALTTIFKRPIRIIGAGRTDAGVHALGQVAHFEVEDEVDLLRLKYSLNGLLPPEIRIHNIESVPTDFHAQRKALSKIYHYNLWLDSTDDPFLTRYHYHFRRKMSQELLQEAAKHFIGQHDFASFTNVGSSAKTTVRHIYRLDVVEQRGGLRLEFEGNGFLYKMVRNITGTLLEVATFKKSLDDLPLLFAAKERQKAPATAPARGLFLIKVNY